MRPSRPLLLIKGFRFAPVNAHPAPLTARTVRRREPPTKGIWFFFFERKSRLKTEENESKGDRKMRTVIELYVLRYGLVDSLTEIGEGIAALCDSYEGEKDLTEAGRTQLKKGVAEVFRLRNQFAKETSALEHPSGKEGQ
jgi:hypothetical protein